MTPRDQIVLRQLEELQIPDVFHLAAKALALMANLALTKVLKTTAVSMPTQAASAHSEAKV
jgi:hypothetical protein